MIRLLVPVDGSKHSDKVIAHVIRLNRLCGPMEIHLVNVQEPADSPGVRRFRLPEQIRKQQLEHGETFLRRACSELEKAGVAFHAHVLIGDVPDTIVHLAASRKCDHIVMGTRGQTGLRGLLLGSVASKVIRLATRPVTLIK